MNCRKTLLCSANCWNERYYFTLCTCKKTRLFLFLINGFWSVYSKSAVHFIWPALENPDNPENTNFSGLSRISGVGLNKWTSVFISLGQKTLHQYLVNSENYR